MMSADVVVVAADGNDGEDESPPSSTVTAVAIDDDDAGAEAVEATAARDDGNEEENGSIALEHEPGNEEECFRPALATEASSAAADASSSSPSGADRPPRLQQQQQQQQQLGRGDIDSVVDLTVEGEEEVGKKGGTAPSSSSSQPTAGDTTTGAEHLDAGDCRKIDGGMVKPRRLSPTASSLEVEERAEGGVDGHVDPGRIVDVVEKAGDGVRIEREDAAPADTDGGGDKSSVSDIGGSASIPVDVHDAPASDGGVEPQRASLTLTLEEGTSARDNGAGREEVVSVTNAYVEDGGDDLDRKGLPEKRLIDAVVAVADDDKERRRKRRRRFRRTVRRETSFIAMITPSGLDTDEEDEAEEARRRKRRKLQEDVQSGRRVIIDVDAVLKLGPHRILPDAAPSSASLSPGLSSGKKAAAKRYGPKVPALVPSNAAVPPPRIAADEESERILAEAFANCDAKESLVRPEDKQLLTDYVFLTTRQAALCRAEPSDFQGRGKRNKQMRIGFAGFCCKHCSAADRESMRDGGTYLRSMDSTCRSFCSGPDALASTVPNSFGSHLMKCRMIPVATKQALATYKRLHSKQMARLVQGSQRRFYQKMWARLREADATVEPADLAEGGVFVPTGGEQSVRTCKTVRDGAATLMITRGRSPVGRRSVGVRPPSMGLTVFDEEWGHHPAYVVSHDEETQRVLEAVSKEDPAANDMLILPEDRPLISDFIFLSMKQIKEVRVTASDLVRARRGSKLKIGFRGLCCKHCMNDEERSKRPLSARTFPISSDHLAVSISVALFQHMLKCPSVPNEIKTAMQKLKVIHADQVALLGFGSQRHFFELLYSRLRSGDEVTGKTEFQGRDIGSDRNLQHHESATDSLLADDSILIRHGFVQSPSECFMCVRCRMVPIELRAPGSLSIDRPVISFLHRHKSICTRDSFHLSILLEISQGMVKMSDTFTLSQLLLHPSFRAVVSSVVGGNEALTSAFTNGVVEEAKRCEDKERQGASSSGIHTAGLWSKFPTGVDINDVQKAVSELLLLPGVSPAILEGGLLKFIHVIAPCFDATSLKLNADGGRINKQLTA